MEILGSVDISEISYREQIIKQRQLHVKGLSQSDTCFFVLQSLIGTPLDSFPFVLSTSAFVLQSSVTELRRCSWPAVGCNSGGIHYLALDSKSLRFKHPWII